MKKLLRGIAEFRRTKRPEYRETFARLAQSFEGQNHRCRGSET